MTPSSSIPAGGSARGTIDEFRNAADALRPDRSRFDRRLREAAAFLEGDRIALATKLLEEFLENHPRDLNALYLMAECAIRQGRNTDTEILLARCVELAPEFIAARFRYANALLQANKPEAALAEAEQLLRKEPRNPLFRRLKAVALEGTGSFPAAALLWRDLIEDYPTRLDCWERYGHALRGMGLREESIAAYRRVAELNPGYGGGWWSLADLKTFRFSEAEIARMESQLARPDLQAQDRLQLHFSLGKAYADLKLYEKSFGNYARGNAIYRLGIKHDPNVMTAYVARCKTVFTADFFRKHDGSGCRARDPIFLVGMPRAGSTLVEQILASHSQIEGTRELFDLAAISRHLQFEIAPGEGADYPGVLEKLDGAFLKQLGERYLEGTRVHRKLGRPFFTDKMGPNFVHIGLLHLLLPNARIVDVRRHPMACCFSIFVQLFPKGQNDSYRLTDIANVYRDYVELMEHFDRVLPGKVHRVFYENLVAQPETEVCRMLDYLGLPFEQTCLQFHNTDRVVTTASSEQVRRPLYRDALEQWRHYEPWLGQLKTTLGSIVDAYPAIAVFA